MGVQSRQPGSGAIGATWLRRAGAGQWRPLSVAAFFIVLWQACEAMVPVLIGVIIDRGILPGDSRAMAGLILLLCLLFGVLSLSFRVGARLSVRARENAANDAREALAARLVDPRTVPDAGHRPSAVVSVLGDDCDRVAGFLAMVPFALGAVASVAVSAVLLFDISTTLGVLVLTGVPLLLLVIHRLGAPLERRAAREQSLAAHAAAVATDLIGGLRVLKGFGGEQAAGQRYLIASRRSLRATLSSARAEALYDAIAAGATLAFLACVVLVGARRAMDGRIAVGELVAAVGLAVFLLGPMNRLAGLGAARARALASAARIAAVLATPQVAAGSRARSTDPGGRLRVATPGLALAVGSGESVGIVADPRSAAALIRILTDRTGSVAARVQVDGVDLADLDPSAAARTLLVARHHEVLFSQSLWDNVRAGGWDPVRVVRALSAADADQVAASLPDGVHTILAEQGRSLSSGQRQRVALARALAMDPAVLVLHDPTTAVDTATAARIATGVRELRRGRTTVLISTDPVLLATCDRVVLVSDSQLRATGTHQELRERDPLYRGLVLA